MKRSEERGFTLIELLVGLTIFSVVILSIYSTFSTGILARRKGGNAADSIQMARVTLDDIGSELRNMVAYSGYELAGGPEEISFPVIDHHTERGVGLSLITYSLKDDSSLKTLVKRSQVLGGLSQIYELASEVKELSFSYAYVDSSSDNLQWKATWSSPDTLPQAVKAVLTLETKEKGQAITFIKVISLPLSR